MSTVRLAMLFLALGSAFLCCSLESAISADEPERKINPWVYRPPARPALPAVRAAAWAANPIDCFILAKLEAQGLAPSPRADKRTLLRRVTVDLTGLPPTAAEQEEFLADDRPDAYERVVDRLLASPRYGERWAQHWLDLVRYAETDGFKADELRPNAFRYRDYVIRTLNADMPYDRFLRQQLAGDELEPDNPDAIIATGFDRLWPDEYNSATLELRHQETLDDMTEVAGLAFLGLTMGCARCHDHKFDPLSQKDYFRFQAFFAAMRTREDLVAASDDERRQHQEKLAEWEAATQAIRTEMDQLTAAKRTELRKNALTKFRTEIQQAELTPEKERTPYQEQIALLAEKQMDRAEKDAPAKLPEEAKKRYQELEKQLAEFDARKPKPLPPVMGVTDQGRAAPPTHLLAGGDWRKPREELTPGFPEVFGDAAPDTRLADGVASTGRRAALARWLTRPDHPLTARVVVNRLWQHHFGLGIVPTPSDFGVQGQLATHPELLDWLATEFVARGWSLKQLHRLMVTSAAYCQTSLVDPGDPAVARAIAVDRENRLLWHARRQRLEGEAIRDAMLAATGELNRRMGGPSARPKLPEKLSNYAWKPDAEESAQNRRSIYVLAKRNLRYPLFDAFDLPDMHNSCPRRSHTTTAPQALLLLNGDFTLDRARKWAAQLTERWPSDPTPLVTEAYRTAWGRPPTDEEVRLGADFIAKQTTAHNDRTAAVIDFCQAVMNTNEFVYVD